MVSAEDAMAWGMTGASLRGSGVNWDIRKRKPYCGMSSMILMCLWHGWGCLCSLPLPHAEMWQSLRIIRAGFGQLA